MNLRDMFKSAAGSIVGGIGGTILDQFSAHQSYRRARDMRQTAYQDTMGDMRAAGLNPILAYGKGPTNATAIPMSVQGASNLQTASANELRGKQSNVAKMQEALISTQSWATAAQGAFASAQKDLVDQNVHTAKMRNQILEKALPALGNKADYESQNEWLQKIKATMEALGFSTNSLLNTIK